MSLPAELLIDIARVAHPLTARSIRISSKLIASLITPKLLAHSEACWRWRVKGKHSCLLWAARNGLVNIVVILLESSPSNWPDHRAALWDAFTSAAGNGHVECLREIGKVVSFALQPFDDSDKHSLEKAFGLAANGGHMDAVKLLMSDIEDGGFRPSIGKHGPLRSALEEALEGNRDDVVRYLLSFVGMGDFEGVFIDVVSHGNVPILRSMLELMEDGVAGPYNEEEMLDWAFCVACRVGNVEIMDILYEAGAALDGDGEGGSPLFDAARNDCIEALDYLLTHGISATADRRERYGFYGEEVVPLTLCSSFEAVQLLLSHGANPNVTGEVPFFHVVTTPLASAAANSNPASMKALLDAGADPRAEDDLALCCAIIPGRYARYRCPPDPACVDILLGTFPPNTPIPDKVWAVAAKSGKVDIFNRFLEFDPPAPPRAGAHIAALHLAAEKGHDGILQALRDAGLEMVDRMVEAEMVLNV
ncbi:hypothetical protein HK104_001113 [Borealophlyctis nickersoniae]|nr:hypothetical protein HK104_001113 [Borealophlyctis nickersoniae]